MSMSSDHVQSAERSATVTGAAAQQSSAEAPFLELLARGASADAYEQPVLLARADGRPAEAIAGLEHAKVLALQEEVSRADADYQRLRGAYLDIVQKEPTHEVALAMIGADMDRAHARLQALIGLPRLPFTHEPSAVMRRE